MSRRALQTEPIAPLLAVVTDPDRVGEWRRCVLSGGENGSRLVASPVALRSGPAIKLVRTVGRREETEIVALVDWPALLERLLGESARVHLLTAAADWHARRTKKGRWLVSRGKPSQPAGPSIALAAHDRERHYPLPPEDPGVQRLLVATGLFSPGGRLRADSADKYRQVQHFVELLRPLPIWDASHDGRPLRILDGGCGKAAMSLALYLYAELQGVPVELTGLDTEPEIVEKASTIAAEVGYRGARFEASTIQDFARLHAEDPAVVPLDLFVSLHACDTATDEAIAAGVELEARSIVVAPCCHHELAGQLCEPPAWAAALEHGLLRGRLADIVTDALRAAALEALGYKADVLEFVAAEHTPKNLMIRAVRRDPGEAKERAQERGRERYRRLAEAWEVEPALERLLGERLV